MPPPISAGGRTGVALLEGDAVAAGVGLTSPTGVAVGAPETAGVDVAEIAVPIESSAPDESPEELQAATNNKTSSAASNAGAFNTCRFGPVRRSVVDGKLLC